MLTLLGLSYVLFLVFLDIKDKNIKIKLQNFYIVTNFLKYDINILITEGENNLIKVNSSYISITLSD